MADGTFFMWIKQHLWIKVFYATAENSVNFISYLVVQKFALYRRCLLYLGKINVFYIA